MRNFYTSEGYRIELGDVLTDETMTKFYKVKNIDNLFVTTVEIFFDNNDDEREGEENWFSDKGAARLYLW